MGKSKKWARLFKTPLNVLYRNTVRDNKLYYVSYLDTNKLVEDETYVIQNMKIINNSKNDFKSYMETSIDKNYKISGDSMDMCKAFNCNIMEDNSFDVNDFTGYGQIINGVEKSNCVRTRPDFYNIQLQTGKCEVENESDKLPANDIFDMGYYSYGNTNSNNCLLYNNINTNNNIPN